MISIGELLLGDKDLLVEMPDNGDEINAMGTNCIMICCSYRKDDPVTPPPVSAGGCR